MRTACSSSQMPWLDCGSCATRAASSLPMTTLSCALTAPSEFSRLLGEFPNLTRPTFYTADTIFLLRNLDFSSRLAGKVIFSKVDLIQGYHQVLVRLENVPKTVVITPFGLFEFLHMPFGLCSAGVPAPDGFSAEEPHVPFRLPGPLTASTSMASS
ncbi:hypothetical protein AAFF_G00193550 [Aldrovandia affinis]|uniref:Uncharacterized protein n=1 Tax=Aldrovandia affinis TaxID=143900 RepID=A0AAD7SZB8_9TELE|nr:hypothetical protein AAFF_G00193550 [Aldrovandia affinis]